MSIPTTNSTIRQASSMVGLNETQQVYSSSWFDQGAMAIPLLLFCIFIFIFGVIGNVMIMIYFITKKKMKEMITYHIWIMLLAVSDLFTCVAGFSFFVIIRDQDHFSIALARTSNVCMLVAIFALCGLAYDRYKAIADPFSFKNNKSRILVLYFVIVFACCWLEYMYFCLDRVLVDPLQNMIFYSALYVITDCIFPVAFMAILYHRLSLRLNEITKPLQQQSPATKNALVKRNNEALKIIKALTFLYVINVVPVRLTKITLEYVLYLNLWPDCFKSISMAIQIMMLLLFTNNCINCLVYAGRMKDFRRFIFRLFKPWASFEEHQPIFTSVRYSPSLTQEVTQVWVYMS